MTQAERDAEDKAKADKKVAERASVTKDWQDLYDTGGDKALAEHIKANYQDGAAGWRKSDLNRATQVINTPGTTFEGQAQADYDSLYATWDMMTRYGDQTKYGADGKTLKQIMPWEQDAGYKSWTGYDDFNFSGWVDPQIQIDKDNAAAEKQRKAEEAQRRAQEAALAKQEKDKQITNSFTQSQSSVQDAFGVSGSNNVIGQGPNSNREEAVERAKEYQNNKNNEITSDNNTITNTDTSKAVNNTEKGTTTKTTTWDNSGYVQGLADDAFKKYQGKWGGGGSNQTTNYSNIFNNVKQNAGNSGDWKTNIGNNNKINSSKIGNNYSLNFGSIDLKNEQS